MYTLLVVLVVILALLMILIVLIQESKGGLSSRFDDYKRMLGVNKSNSFIEKATWILAGIITLICVAMAYVLFY